MEKQKQFRTVLFYRTYFQEVFQKQREKLQNKIIWTLSLIEEIPKVPETYLKHLEGTDGLFEIRIQQGSDSIRFFCFFDNDRQVIVLNGFVKKSQKTPAKERLKAEMLKKEYENEKT